MSDLSNDTKKHTTKSREAIPLNRSIVQKANTVACFGVCEVSWKREEIQYMLQYAIR
jgi:hypothetical protein